MQLTSDDVILMQMLVCPDYNFLILELAWIICANLGSLPKCDLDVPLAFEFRRNIIIAYIADD